MAEIKPEGSGHKTIKLTPVGTTPENEGVGTSTVKVGRAAQKPQAPAEDLEKTQAIPLKKLKPLAAKPVKNVNKMHAIIVKTNATIWLFVHADRH